MIIKISSLPPLLEPYPVLSWKDLKKTKPVALTDIHKKKEYVERMVQTCLVDGGVGLCANQIGINESFFIIRVSEDEFRAFFNPVWSPSSSETEEDIEGCLSSPGDLYRVYRAKNINVGYHFMDEDGNIVRAKGKLSGFPARVFQHEAGHLILETIKDIGTLVSSTKDDLITLV